MTIKILAIEDDRDIAELLEYNLRQERFDCAVAASGSEGLALARRNRPDLIVLDLMLPDIGGLEICRILRAHERTRHIPILMLTAKGEEVDRIVGFEVGADDYLTKPFSVRELILRIRAILKRRREGNEESASAVLTFGMLHIDPLKFKVSVAGKNAELTATEFKLLHHLLSNRGRVATRDTLLDRVWGYDAACTTRTVDTHIRRLREKLGMAGDYIETIRGVGYRFREDLGSR